jgi:hypothetical protein
VTPDTTSATRRHSLAEPLGFERVEVKINEAAPPGWSRLGIWAGGLCYDQPEGGFVPN